jgi:hypothetical protein
MYDASRLAFADGSRAAARSDGECFTFNPAQFSSSSIPHPLSNYTLLNKSNNPPNAAMPPTATIRRSLPQTLESLHHGTGASIHLPASVRAVSIQYTYKRAGKNVQYVASPFQIPSSYRSFVIPHHLKPSLTHPCPLRGNREFLSKIAPRLSFANPHINLTTSHRPTPSTKSKDPALQARASASAEEIAQHGSEPRVTVEFRTSFLSA